MGFIKAYKAGDKMKKAFTFVEIAIVLVIIGLIMGMVLKGRSLIDSARLRGEVRKVEKIRTVVAASLTTGQGGFALLPIGSDVSPMYFDLEKIALNGGLLPKDVAIGGSKNWLLQVCRRRADNNTEHFIDVDHLVGIRLCLVNAVAPARIFCSVEKMLDDSNNKNGDGRSDYIIQPDTVCEDIGSADSGTYHYIVY